MVGNPIETMLTWDGLYTWATSHPIVGDTNSSHYCPIARYLDETTDDDWTVDDGQVAKLGWGNCDEKEWYTLPEWARIVADAVDALHGERVTREQFLAIMDSIQPVEET